MASSASLTGSKKRLHWTVQTSVLGEENYPVSYLIYCLGKHFFSWVHEQNCFFKSSSKRHDVHFRNYDPIWSKIVQSFFYKITNNWYHLLRVSVHSFMLCGQGTKTKTHNGVYFPRPAWGEKMIQSIIVSNNEIDGYQLNSKSSRKGIAYL